MTPVNLAVIGADRRGKLSLLAHQPGNGTRIIAACGLSLDPLGEYRDRCGDDVLLTVDYREILARKDIDAVFIATPDYLHEEHAVAALEAGKYVFLEKPMAISIEGCDRILTTAEKHGDKLYVGHNMRFFPTMQKMKQLIVEGKIGRVESIWCRHFISYGGDAYFKDWHSERRYTNGLLLQKGAHDIDIIHWLADGFTEATTAMGKLSVYDKLPRRANTDPQPFIKFNRSNWPPKATSGYSPKIDVEDHSMVLLQLNNGVQASYLQSHYTPDDQRNYTIIGTEGRIENYGDHSTPEQWAAVHLWNRRTGYSERGHEVFPIPPIEGEHGGADPLVVEDFIRFIRTGRHEGASPFAARMAVAVGCLATDSLRQGSRLQQVPPYRSSVFGSCELPR